MDIVFLEDQTIEDLEKLEKVKYVAHHLEDLDSVLPPTEYGDHWRDAQPQHRVENIPVDIEPIEDDEQADKEPTTELLLRRSNRQLYSSKYPPDEITDRGELESYQE